jgi:hypothetical protein
MNYALRDELQTCFLYLDMSITALYWHFLSGVLGSFVLHIYKEKTMAMDELRCALLVDMFSDGGEFLN